MMVYIVQPETNATLAQQVFKQAELGFPRSFCLSCQDAKVPHLGESAFRDTYSAANNVPEAYLNTDLSSALQHLAPRAGSPTLEQAFDCLEPFGATVPQKHCHSWPAQRQPIIQEQPSPRMRQACKRKMTRSGLNERYARMTVSFVLGALVHSRLYPKKKPPLIYVLNFTPRWT